MEEVGSTENAAVYVDKQKNRIYLIFSGDILDPAANRGVSSITRKGCALLRPGFTCLADFTQMNLLSLTDGAQSVQAALFKAGVKKVASVWSHDSFAKMIVDKSSEKVGSEYVARRQRFTDRPTAEQWLDD